MHKIQGHNKVLRWGKWDGQTWGPLRPSISMNNKEILLVQKQFLILKLMRSLVFSSFLHPAKHNSLSEKKLYYIQ